MYKNLAAFTNNILSFAMKGAFAAGISGQLIGAWIAIGLKFRGENMLDLPAPTYACENINYTYVHPAPHDYG